MCKKSTIVQIILILTIISLQAVIPQNFASRDTSRNISIDHLNSAYGTQEGLHIRDLNSLPEAREQSGIPIVQSETLRLRPLGKIIDAFFVDGKIVIRGENYIYVNGTNRIFWANETIVSIDYGDVDGDSKSEYAVLGETNLFLLDDNLYPMWNSEQSKNFDRVLIAKLSDLGQIIVLWEFNSSFIAYYSLNGTLLNETSILHLGSPAKILDLGYTSSYLVGLIPCISPDNKFLGNKLVKWTYHDPNSIEILDPPCSPIINVDEYIYVLQYYTGIGCFLHRIYNGSIIKSISIPSSTNWRTLIEHARYFGYMDVDKDDSFEFLAYNETHILTIDTSNNTSNVVQTYMVGISIDQGVLYSEGVVTLIENELRIFDMTLTMRRSIMVAEGSMLVEGLEDILAISSRGDCIYVEGSDLLVARPYINGGWSYTIDKNTLVIYNAHSTEIFWVDGSTTYRTTETIISAVAMTNSALLISNRNAIFIRRDGSIISININISSSLMGDYGRGKLFVVMSNGTLVTYDIATGVLDRWYPPPGYKPISIYCHGSNWIYSLLRNTSSYAELGIYSYDGIIKTIRVNLNNINLIRAMVVVGDKDLDDLPEIAYSLLVQNKTLHCNYTWGVFENDVSVWEVPPTLIRMPSPQVFTVFSSAGGYVFVNNTRILRVLMDGHSDEFSFNDYVVGGCEAGVLTNGRGLIFTSRGKTVIDLDEYRAGIGRYGLYSWLLYINGSYYLKNLSVVIDFAPPRISILSPATGEILDSIPIIVSWRISDDLELQSAELYIDDAFVGNIGSEGEVAISNITEGNHTITIRAQDNANRISENRTWFVVDLPLLLEAQAPNNTWLSTPTINISLYVYGYADNISLLRNDTLILADLKPNTTTTVELLVGINILRIEATGYGDFVSISIVVGYDPYPPIIRLISPQNNSVIETEKERVKVNISLEIEDLSGVSRVVLIYGNLTAEITTYTTLDIPIGDYYFVIGAYDTAGNYAFIILHITIKPKKEVGGEILGDTHVFVGAMILGIAIGTIIIRRRRRQ